MYIFYIVLFNIITGINNPFDFLFILIINNNKIY